MDIVKAVKQAEEKASMQDPNDIIKTVLFFDEANTTEHLGLIKEIMCDHRMLGKDILKDVRVVAAINPYRRYAGNLGLIVVLFVNYRHHEEMIQRIKSAGLGFFAENSDAHEKLG